MRKLFTILAILGLALSIGALSARADGVTYTVVSTYASEIGIPTTSVSAPGATFTFVFTVPSPCSSPQCDLSSGVMVDLSSMVTFCSTKLATSCSAGLVGFTAPADLTFNPNPLPGGGFYPGLFGIVVNGFDWEFVGPQIFTSTGTTATFLTAGSPFAIMGGTDFDDSFFFDMSTLAGGDLTGGSVTGSSSVSTPEPSSLLLLGSGFLALGGFARKRLIARLN
jgi:hypothetical protein